MRRVLLAFAAAILMLPPPGFGKMVEPPESFKLQDKSLQHVERRVLGQIDRASLLAEDSPYDKSPRRPLPLRFAVAENAALGLDNAGTWQELHNGRLWRLVIHAPQAVSLNLGITRFQMPEGAKLWLYDAARKRVEGSYTARHRSRHGRLWTPIIEGDEVVVEVFVPFGAGNPALTIGSVNKGYRDLGKVGGDKNHGACNNDVICPEGDAWREQIRSVARYTIDGTRLCTGQLVNNTAQNSAPYFLSANHCGVSAVNDDTLVFYWNYQSSVCGAQGGGSLAQNQTGSIFRSANAASDFLLVELANAPDPAFNVFFAGWDATGVAPDMSVDVHHPSGDVKSISFNDNPVTSTAYGSTTVDAAGNHWRVDSWEDGTTESGSSGSCLWSAASQRCVGQLHGGFASCAAPFESDWFGKLSVSWAGGGTADTRLRDWLDPGSTGNLFLDGATNPSPTPNPVPGVASLAPNTAFAGAAAFTLTVNGSNFVNGATVRWDGAPRVTTFGSATQLLAAVTAADIAAAGVVSVTVSNPTPGGGTSNAASFTVNTPPPPNPVPSVSGLSPSTLPAGGAAFTLTVNGSNFVNGAVLRWNGAARATTFTSATQLSAAIPAADIAAAGVASVTVFNPAPDGGLSNTSSFTVTNPVPNVVGSSPNSVLAGAAAFTLTVNGSNFVNGSTVHWNGAARATTFASATQLSAAISAADIAAAGVVGVTVFNPTPGGGTSNTTAFTVTASTPTPNPVPSVAGLSPGTLPAGGAAFVLTVTGLNFVNGATVRWNGAARATTFASAMQLSAAISAADVAAAGVADVTVFNPVPGGGTSNAASFFVTNPVPAVVGLGPSSVLAGGAAFAVTVNGSNFVNGAIVLWNGFARLTTFASAAQLSATITAADIAAAGVASVAVVNPTPGGGTSNTSSFTVANPVPNISGLSPSTARPGSAAFTLVVNGSDFVNGAAVFWNGAARATTFGSTTELTAAISEADIAAAGVASVAVVNPGPGGGTSNSSSFILTNPLPGISGLSPSSVQAGGAAFALTVNGNDFVNGATVRWNGAARATRFASATELSAAISAADVAVAGTVTVAVSNPAPGGGSSNAMSLAITNASPPSDDGGGGCFIATAAFGTPMAEQVRYLRAFRDEHLLTSAWGRAFVRWYYRVSPSIASTLRRHDTWRTIARVALQPLIAISRLIVSQETVDAQTADRP